MEKDRSLSYKKGTSEHSIKFATNMKYKRKKYRKNLKQIDQNFVSTTLTTWKKPLLEIFKELNFEVIDRIISEITLTKPRKAFTLFLQDCSKEMKEKMDFGQRNTYISQKWKELTPEEQRPYLERALKERDKYNKDFIFIKHFLFLGYDGVKNKRNQPLEYYILLRRIETHLMNKDIIETQDFEENCKNSYNDLSEEEKEKFETMAKERKKWLENAKTIQKITPLSIFALIEKKVAENKGEKIPTVEELKDKWTNFTVKKRYSYYDLYEKVINEREVLFNVYSILKKSDRYIKKVKLRNPFQLYCDDLQANNKGVGSISVFQAEEMWKDLNEEIRKEYLKKYARLELAKKYKDLVEEKLKKIKRRKLGVPLNVWNMFLKTQKGKNLSGDKNKKAIKQLRDQYRKLSPSEKKELLKKCDEQYKAYLSKEKKNKSKIHQLPQKVPSEFTLFCKDHKAQISDHPTFKRDRNYNKTAKLLYDELSTEEKKKYKEKKQELVEDYEKKMKEYEENGYYTLTQKNEDKINKVLKKENLKEKNYRLRKEKREQKKLLKKQEEEEEKSDDNRMDIDEDYSINKNNNNIHQSQIANYSYLKKAIKKNQTQLKINHESDLEKEDDIKIVDPFAVNNENENNIRIVGQRKLSSIDIEDEDED